MGTTKKSKREWVAAYKGKGNRTIIVAHGLKTKADALKVLKNKGIPRERQCEYSVKALTDTHIDRDDKVVSIDINGEQIESMSSVDINNVTDR